MSDNTNKIIPWTESGRDVGAKPYPIPETSKKVQTSIPISLSDGLELVADLYVPGGEPPFPAVVEITAYGTQRLAREGGIYAARGYLFLAVDTRGRYRSDGIWEPLVNDQEDYHAVIHWLTKHKLCNGLIGTRGHSYSGYNQMLGAIDAPEALKAMAVTVAPGDPFDNVPFQGGAYDINDLFWLFDMTGRVVCGRDPDLLDTDNYDDSEDDGEDEDDTPEEKEHDRLIDTALKKRPFRDIDLRFGLRHDTFREWVSHWQLDDYWRKRSVGKRIDRIKTATLFVSGWWDGNGRGAPAFYRGLRDRISDSTMRDSQRLVIGPWDHDLNAPDCDDLPEYEAAAIERAALRDSLNDELTWFDTHLKGIDSDPSSKGRVTLFITGLNRWLDFEDFPPPDSKTVVMHLNSGKDRQSGSLQSDQIPDVLTKSTYTFDPDDPTPFAHDDVDGERMPFDGSDQHRERQDTLIYTTESIESPMVIIGDVSLVLYAAADVPDFDLCARLFDVYPDGRSIFLTDGIIRARFRKGWDKPVLVPINKTHEYQIDLWHLGHLVRPGHSLRLEVASGAFGRFDVNPCTGGSLAAEIDSQTAKITLLHGPDHPARLKLTVNNDPRLATVNP